MHKTKSVTSNIGQPLELLYSFQSVSRMWYRRNHNRLAFRAPEKGSSKNNKKPVVIMSSTIRMVQTVKQYCLDFLHSTLNVRSVILCIQNRNRTRVSCKCLKRVPFLQLLLLLNKKKIFYLSPPKSEVSSKLSSHCFISYNTEPLPVPKLIDVHSSLTCDITCDITCDCRFVG